jgi:hypothetical protein
MYKSTVVMPADVLTVFTLATYITKTRTSGQEYYNEFPFMPKYLTTACYYFSSTDNCHS